MGITSTIQRTIGKSKLSFNPDTKVLKLKIEVLLDEDLFKNGLVSRDQKDILVVFEKYMKAVQKVTAKIMDRGII